MAKTIKKVIPAVLKPVLDKRGFAQAQVILDWEKIVGTQIAQFSVPERIVYYKNASRKGTLVLAATPGWAPIITHGSQQMIDRINVYFGYEAVSRLQLKQTLYIKNQASQHSIKIASSETDEIAAEEFTDIPDLDLRKAMATLKRSLKNQNG